MRIWVITDTHFGHKMLHNHGRPADFELQILRNLSKRLLPGDTLIHLGDFCIGRDALWHDIFNRSVPSGVKKILVRGNHDNKPNDWYLAHGWDFVCEAYLVKLFGKQVLFSHMPVAEDVNYWVPHWPVDKNVHGHFHGNNHRSHEYRNPVYDYEYHYDCAPDIHLYEPVLLSDILKG